MSTSKSGNKAYDDSVATAEAARQIAVAGATQASVNSAEMTFARAGLKAALANGCSPSCWTMLLKHLGVQS